MKLLQNERGEKEEGLPTEERGVFTDFATWRGEKKKGRIRIENTREGEKKQKDDQPNQLGGGGFNTHFNNSGRI